MAAAGSGSKGGAEAVAVLPSRARGSQSTAGRPAVLENGVASKG